MSAATGRAAWSLAFVGLVALLWLASRSGVDSAAQDGYSRDLRRLQALDARLNDHVMRSRSGAVVSYDPIVQTFAELRRLDRRLERAPPFMSQEGRDEMAARRSDFEEALLVKEERVDAFKTNNAVLRNSLQFFPVAAKDLALRLASEPGASGLAARVDDLLRDVLLLNLVPDEEMIPRAKASLARVETGPVSEAHGADVNVLVLHARVILGNKPVVDNLVGEILRLPLSARAEQFEAAYSRRYHAALEASGRRRLLLALLAIAIVGAASAAVILRLKRAAEELAAANAALRREREREKELSDLKSRFVSMTSHEFRTPLSIILSSSEMLEAYADRWPAEKKRTHFLRIHAAVKGMTKLLDGILLIGRAEAGALSCSPGPIDVPGLSADLVESMQESAGKQHRIELDVGGRWDDVALDERLVGQILTNLLSNAIKYSPDGGTVRLSVCREGSDAVIEIEDHGIGIPAEDQPRLFELFHRGSNVRTISGTGLGLVIVKKAVDLHGGTISFESRLGEGTRFVARLPVLLEAGSGADTA